MTDARQEAAMRHYDACELCGEGELCDVGRALFAARDSPAEDAVGLDRRIREYLWLSHGHRGLYGDDGEMQCSECGAEVRVWDYRREPLTKLLDALTTLGQSRIVAAMKPASPITISGDEALALWKLKLLIEEDEDAEPVEDRFLVWLASASDAKGVRHQLCIGSGSTRDLAAMDAETELRGALALLAKAHAKTQ